MCGRYRLSRRKQLIEQYFEAASEVDRYETSMFEHLENITNRRPFCLTKLREEFVTAQTSLLPRTWGSYVRTLIDRVVNSV